MNSALAEATASWPALFSAPDLETGNQQDPPDPLSSPQSASIPSKTTGLPGEYFLTTTASNVGRLVRFSRAACVVATLLGEGESTGKTIPVPEFFQNGGRERRQKAYRALSNRGIPGVVGCGGLGLITGLD